LSTESSVDDLGTCRGVVLRRAVTILRSIETQPLTGRFVRSVGQSSLAVVSFFYYLVKVYREHSFKVKNLEICANSKSFCWKRHYQFIALNGIYSIYIYLHWLLVFSITL